MNTRTFALLAALAASLATLVALHPILRFLGKIGSDTQRLALTFFRDQSLLRIGIGALWIAGAVYLHAKRPGLAVTMLVVAPIIVWLADIGLWVAGK